MALVEGHYARFSSSLIDAGEEGFFIDRLYFWGKNTGKKGQYKSGRVLREWLRRVHCSWIDVDILDFRLCSFLIFLCSWVKITGVVVGFGKLHFLLTGSLRNYSTKIKKQRTVTWIRER